ncbi:MAG: lipoyl(octanoyl) transferase LipB [Candidatus Omnitrophota bacterium]|jgi:lipoate-protein ligase B
MKVKFFDLGLTDYTTSHDFQKQLLNKVKDNEIEHALISCRHYPVITLGRQAKLENLLVSEKELEKNEIKLIKVERGGDITYHGPGQLTIYPIFNLSLLKKDIHFFMRNLERVTIAALMHFNIKASQRQGLTGVWINNEKIASIGIAVRQWVTCHGITINIKRDDLGNFSLIRPCGMDIMMTSMESILGENIDIDKVGKIFNKEIMQWPK